MSPQQITGARQVAANLAAALPPTMSRQALAERTGYAVSTLANLASEGRGPKYHRAPGGRRVVYLAADVAAWLAGGGR